MVLLYYRTESLRTGLGTAAVAAARLVGADISLNFSSFFLALQIPSLEAEEEIESLEGLHNWGSSNILNIEIHFCYCLSNFQV